MLKIIPKEELEYMVMKDVDKEHHGYYVAFDVTDFYPEDKGYLLAISDDYDTISDYVLSLPDKKDRCIFIRGANRLKWESGYAQEVYLW